MKKHYSLIIALFTLTLACKKSDFQDRAQNCKILETADRFFSFDAANRPLAFTYKEEPDLTGNPTFHFAYDSDGRLIGYGGFDSHALTYNSDGVAIIDTFIQNYAGQNEQFELRLSYDSYGRLTQVVSKHYHSGEEDLPLPHSEETTTYSYDKRGNLIRPSADGTGLMKYDHKTNINRTNPIFMLINRDYSLNNPVGDTKYNSVGLPYNYYETFLEGRGVERDIVYMCDKKNDK